MLAAEGEAHLAAGQVTAHAGGGFQAEGAAAGQQDAVHAVRDVAGAERIDFLRAGGAAADIDAAHGALLAEDGGATGDGVKIGNVANANSRDVCKSLHRWVFRVL